MQTAIRLDPFNAEYPAGLGDILTEQGKGQVTSEAVFDTASMLYRKAAALNPSNAEYWIRLGTIELYSGAGKPESGKIDGRRKTMEYFKEAFRKDPSGVYTSYMIGYAAISIWKLLDAEERKFILERLRYVILMYPSRSGYIYSKLWNHTEDFKVFQTITPENLVSDQNLYAFIVNNNLWQFRKEVIAKLNYYKHLEEPVVFEKERRNELKRIQDIKRSFMKQTESIDISYAISKEEWRGKAYDEKTEIVNGVMYWNGTVYVPLKMKPGCAVITINARRFLMTKLADSNHQRFYPYIIVRVDDEEIGEMFIKKEEWNKYTFSAKTDGGIRVLSVSFVNDEYYNPVNFEERNIEIGDVSITYAE
ncbi:MAG: carbohydrate-binding domain-containing protein [Candidatus Omnitrophota bacterium]